MTPPETSVLKALVRLLQKIEDYILIGLLILMILMAVLQIALRNFFDSGVLWGDELIRILVLWIGLIGAMVASRNNNHISIDIISRYLPDRLKRLNTFLISIFTSGVCAVMAYFSFSFVVMEKGDGLTAFGAVPAWVCESIIPFAFAVISLRYLAYSLSQFFKTSGRSLP